MGGREKQSGVRTIREGASENASESACAQIQLPKDEGTDKEGPVDSTQVRQPEVREAEPSQAGDSQGEQPGRPEEGATLVATNQEPLSKGTPENAGSERSKSVPVVREQTEQRSPVPIEAKEGRLVGANLDQEYRLAKAYHMSGLMPKGLNTPEKVLVALQICRELDLPPMTSVGNIAVINGTPSLFGNLPLALCMRYGLEKIEETTYEQDNDAMYAVCNIKRTGMQEITRRFSMNDAKKAGLFKNDVWNKYPKRMLQCRARAWALKDAFPDVLMGIAQVEYDFNTVVENGEAVGVTGLSSVMQKLNSMMTKAEEATNGGEL